MTCLLVLRYGFTPVRASSDSTFVSLADSTLQRVLPILYDDWFRYEDLSPTFMWLVHLTDNRFHPVDPLPSPLSTRDIRHVYVLDHLSLTPRAIQDWLRFQAVHSTRQWDATSKNGMFVPSIGLLGPKNVVYSVGHGYVALHANGEISLDLVFGPKYGRGYSIAPDGSLTSTWVS